ncbi:MAG: DUF4329 domain-containing protein [Arenibacterium sp.]
MTKSYLGTPLLITAVLLIPGGAPAQDAAEVAFAKSVLSQLQSPSFQSNREFCGMIGETEEGRLVASKPKRGGRDGCRPNDPRDAVEVFASFHTHAGFDEGADSELPSVEDVLSDMDEGVDGYLATPGGRCWFIDGQSGSVRQICGLGCLPQDPDFVPGVFGPIRKRYSLGELERRAGQFLKLVF